MVLAAMIAAALASAAFAAQPLPGTKTPADRAAWRSILKWPAACEKEWKTVPSASASGVSTWRTASGKRLVEVTCFFGAYQGVFMLYLVDSARNAAGPLALRTYRDPGSGKPRPTTTTRILGIPSFTPRTGVLTVLEKFRGIGDCGIYSVYKLSGSRFVTTAVRAKTACDGKSPGPTRWPTLPLP